MKKMCPNCENKNIEKESMSDCERCGIHVTYHCGECSTYFDKPKVVPSLSLSNGDDLYKK